MIEKMKNKLLTLEQQFDSMFTVNYESFKGHGGTPFVDNSKGKMQKRRREKADEHLHNLKRKIELQKEKIVKAEYRHDIKTTQTKKSIKFISENQIHLGLFELEKKKILKQWPRNPEYFFIIGMNKIALKTFEGKVGIAARFPAKTEEDFKKAKELVIAANSFKQ